MMRQKMKLTKKLMTIIKKYSVKMAFKVYGKKVKFYFDKLFGGNCVMLNFKQFEI